MRCQECLAARRCPAVDGDLNQYFFDLVDSYATRKCSIGVNAQFLKPAESREDTKSQDTPSLLI